MDDSSWRKTMKRTNLNFKFFANILFLALIAGFVSCKQTAKTEIEKEYKIIFLQPEHGTLTAECDGRPFLTGGKLKYGKVIIFYSYPFFR